MSLVDSIKGFVTTADLYAQPIDFTYRDKKSFATTWGGIVSIILGGILVLYAIFLIFETFARDYPFLIQKEYFQETPKIIEIIKDITYSYPDQVKYPLPPYLQNSTFYFYLAFGIQDDANFLQLQLIDQRYFSLRVREVVNTSNVYKVTDKSFFRCNKFGDFGKFHTTMNLSYTYCINDAYSLYGRRGSDFSYLQISVSKCINSTENNNHCKPINEINSKVGNFKMTLYYSANIVNATSKEQPVATTVKNQYWDIIQSWQKYSEMIVSIDQVISYDNIVRKFFSSSSNTYYALKVLGFTDSVRTLDDEQNFFNLIIATSNSYSVIERSYVDIFAQLSNVGGIASIIMPLGIIFVFFFASFRTDESLANDFYNIISPENNKKVNLPFEEFIKEHYDRLVKKELKGLKKEARVEFELEEHQKRIEEQDEFEDSSFLTHKSKNVKDGLIPEEKQGQSASHHESEAKNNSKKNNSKKTSLKKGWIAKIIQKVKRDEERRKREEEEKAKAENNKNEDLEFEKLKQKNQEDVVGDQVLKNEENAEIQEEKKIPEEVKENEPNKEKSFSKKDEIKDEVINISNKPKRDQLPQSQEIELKEIKEKLNDIIESDLNKNEIKVEPKENVEQKENKEPEKTEGALISFNHITDKKETQEQKPIAEKDKEDRMKLNILQLGKLNSNQNKKHIEEAEEESEDEADDREMNGLEQYLTIDIIEKMYGIDSHKRKEEIKEIIKENLKRRKLLNIPTLTKRESRDLRKERYQKFTKLFKKHMMSSGGGGDIEQEIEEMNNDTKQITDLNEGVFEKVIAKYPRNEIEFTKYKILYNLIKYESNDKMFFSNTEIFKKLCCFLCVKREYNKYKLLRSFKKNIKHDKEIKEELLAHYGDSIYVYKKHNIFTTTRRKLAKDLDIINVLHTVKDFEKFKNIYFDKTQKDIFESVTKPTVDHENEKSQPAPDLINKLKTNQAAQQSNDRRKAFTTRSLSARFDSKVGTGTFMNVNMINFDDDANEDESDLKKIKLFDRLLSCLVEDKKLNITQQKLLLNMGIPIDEIVKFNHLLEGLRHRKTEEEIEEINRKIDDEKKILEAYPNIVNIFFNVEKNEQN